MCQDCQPELQLYQCIDGYNAFTITTAAFTMPAEGAGVTIQVSNAGQYTGKWASPGQLIFISKNLLVNGYFVVVSSTNTSIDLINVEDTATGAYTQNAIPGTIFPIGCKVSPAGIQGPAGKTGPTGANGTNGTNGTNAFKVVKNFLTDDIEQDINITYTELTSCSPLPEGCVINGNLDPTIFANLQIQVWLKNPLNGNWLLLSNSSGSTPMDYTVQIDGTTGTITVSTLNNQGLYKIVIIG